VALVLGVAKPRVQRVVHNEPVRQLLVIIGEETRQAERYCEQPGTLRRQVEPVRIRASDDPRQLNERWFTQLVLVEKGVEAAPSTDV
jgi:hypothetical protein